MRFYGIPSSTVKFYPNCFYALEKAIEEMKGDKPQKFWSHGSLRGICNPGAKTAPESCQECVARLLEFSSGPPKKALSKFWCQGLQLKTQ